MRHASKQQPTYHQYEHEDFPNEQTAQYTRKTIIGDKSPVTLESPGNMWDIEVGPSQTITFALQENRSLAILAIRGMGHVISAETLNYKDFLVAHAEQAEQLTIQATSNQVLRLIAIEVPQTVDYPLYPK